MFDLNNVKKNVSKLTSSGEKINEATEGASKEIKPKHISKTSSGSAVIGPSIHIKGDLTGEEDLTIQGNVEGSVNLKQNNLTVGSNGRINANIYAKTITVEGDVKGDLFGEESVHIKQTGKVHGNIVAQRVALEDGAVFKGSIDMEKKHSEHASKLSSSSTPHLGKTDRSNGSVKPEKDLLGIS